MADSKAEETLQIIKDSGKNIEKKSDLDPLIYSYFYKLSAKYYGFKKNYEEFYKNGLQYLAYTHESVRTRSTYFEFIHGNREFNQKKKLKYQLKWLLLY